MGARANVGATVSTACSSVGKAKKFWLAWMACSQVDY